MNAKSCKIGVFAFAIAAMMMVAGVFVITNTDDSEATTLTPTVNVYYYYEGNWECSPEVAYDLYQAIDGAKDYFEYTITTSNGSWVSGYNPNMDYGKISQVNGSGSFAIYAYDGVSQWVNVTTSSLGWIRPFADYGAIVNVPNADISASANVAIVTGAENVNDITGMIALGDVHGHTNTLYKFTLHDNVGTLSFANVPVKTMVNGIWTTVFISASDIKGTNYFDVYGYGSDAYLALIDAVGASLVSDNMNSNKIDAWVEHQVFDENQVYLYSYYTYYSWVVSLFGVGTSSSITSTSSTYWYWMSSAPSNPYLSYNFGYYSQLTGAYNNEGSAFNYTYYTETYPL